MQEPEDEVSLIETPRRAFSTKKVLRKIFPVINWLPKYTIGFALQDVLAGFTVALTEIPQGIAYAGVAQLSPEYGLYSGILGGIMYMIFGTCKDINIGPTAIMALMVKSHVSSLGPDMAVLMAFISGCIIFALGLLRLGFLVEFFSYPVIAGFTTAAALNIASSQLNGFFGLKGKSESFLQAWENFFSNIKQTRKWDVTLAVSTVVFLVILKELKRFATFKPRSDWSLRRNILGQCLFMISTARNAIAVVIGTVLSYKLTDLSDPGNPWPFFITGKVKSGLPAFQLPPFSTNYNGTYYSFTDMMSNYGPIIAFCPLIAILEHVAIARAFSKGKSLDASQELIALGIANTMSSFVGSMPITGSFTRTAVNNASGVKTQAGAGVTCLMVILALSFLTSTFQYIPKATLSGVIVVAMFYLCEFEAFHLLYKSKKLDLIPLTVTLLASLFISLEYGILIGVGLNICFILYSSARPKVDIEREKLPQGEVYVCTPRVRLHFCASQHIREVILKNCTSENSTVVLNGKYIGNIDGTVAQSFSSMLEELTVREQKMVFWNFKKSVIDVCLGVNNNLFKHFREGELEEVVDCPQDDRVTEIDIYSIQ